VRSLLVTNDFPPKVGGIQSYLWELWRRLPPDQTAVLTREQPGADAFDASAPVAITRIKAPLLLPTRRLVTAVNRLASEIDAGLVVFDPALPLGLLGPRIERPYAVIVHGAELAVGARLPFSSRLMRGVLARAGLLIAAGNYPAREVRRLIGGGGPEIVILPPGVDSCRFRPLGPDEIAATRRRFGLPEQGRLIVSHSRLVPRKGMDVLIEAAARLSVDRPDLVVVIAGKGRDERRLTKLKNRLQAPVELLGQVSEADLPALVGSADVWAMLCRTRWLGLEQEGFGIVFLEAAAAGVAQVAGLSGGAPDAVVDGKTGLVVDRPADVKVASDALARLLDDPDLRERLGRAARERAVKEFDYDELAAHLGRALDQLSA
jgi:phosphatidyl-myo-inositol dimannoside synthase